MRSFVSIAAALLLVAAPVRAQAVEFELRTFPESPVIFTDSAQPMAPGVPRRQFVSIKNASRKSIMAVIFEQTVAKGSKTEIVALEHVSIVFAAGEKRRVTIAVADMSQKLQSGEQLGRPVLSVVAVEYLDGTQWNAPTGSH
jgi:hypothetical protein